MLISFFKNHKLTMCLLLFVTCLILGKNSQASSTLSDISEITVLKNSDSFIKKFQTVKQAQKSIWVSVMIFDCSESSRMLFDELLRKQNEDHVDVRILAEGLYMKSIVNGCYRDLKESGLRVVQVFDHLRKGGQISRMMHQKFFVVDNQEVIMGGQNFIKYENQSNWENSYVRDTDVYLKSNRIAQAVSEEFVWMWNFFSKTDKIEQFNFISNEDPLNKSACRILIQNPRRGLDEADEFLTEHLKSAKTSLKMYSPGVFYGKDDFFSILKEKVNNSDFQYELIRPGIAKQADELTMFFNDSIQKNLQQVNPVGIVFSALGKGIAKLIANKGVNAGLKSLKQNYGDRIKVYDYPRYSHSKVYIFDQEIAMMGSVNLDDHSLGNNYEIAFSCDDPRFVNQLTDMFSEDLLKTKQSL